MAFAVTGFSTVAQNFISRQIASNFYKKAPLLALLGALTIGNNNKDSLEIGRPNSGEILSGGIVSPVQRKRLGSVNAYLPRVQLFKTSNSAYRSTSGSGRDALPDVASKTTASHGQAMQGAAEFRWFHLDTPILIWHEDKIRAGREGTREGQAIAMGQVVDEATEVAMQDHLDKLATDLYDASPTSAQQNNDLWPSPIGLLAMVDDETHAEPVMARVNRTTESLWRAQVNTTLTAVDVRKIKDDADFAAVSGNRAGLKIIGNGANLMLCGPTLYQTFRQQVLAQGNGNILASGPIPVAMAKMGVKKEILQLDDLLIMYDPHITDENTVLVGDVSVLKFMIHPDFNFKVTPFVDNTKTGLAKDAYDYAYVSTRGIFSIDNPKLWVKYTAIGT